MATFPEFCFEVEHVSPGNILSDPEGSIGPLYIGLSSKGKLYAGSSNGSRVLASNANSFTVASGFLIYTTTSHLAHFAPLNTLQALLSTPTDDENPLPEWETRRVERGSRIVTAVPSNMSLVLQMPRGNLETINPRPLVMKIVRQYIDM